MSIVLVAIILLSCNQKPQINQVIVSSDIDNFWEAYDKITSTNDSILQLKYLNELFIEKASKGQKALFENRRYKPEEYLEAITQYPKFWNSIRKNTLETKVYTDEIFEGITTFKENYPDLKLSTIYFNMGVFRTPGTGFDDLVLIGSEFALGDTNTDPSEFPKRLSHLKNYYKINPVDHLQFLTIHEYVHTQQKDIVNNTLSQVLFEGIADFVAHKMTDKKSPFKYATYGEENEAKVKQLFEDQMFNFRKHGQWLWNSNNNQFGTHDMGYFVGYKIAEASYNKAEDKKMALKNMIELDYHDEAAVEKFIDDTKYFSGTIEELYQLYESKRPVVTGIDQFKSGTQNVSPNVKEITIHFSKKMNTAMRSTGFGELGKEHFPKVSGIIFSEDGMSVTYKVDLEPNKRYQILLENGYRSAEDHLLKSYLIDFKTAAK